MTPEERNAKLAQVFQLVEDLDFVQDVCTDGYAEPGYRDPEVAVVTGNWNHDKEKTVPAHTIDPDADPDEFWTVSEALEKLGCELEWSDEWTICYQCHRLVRTQPDSYSWKRSYWQEPDACDITCHECILKDPSDYVESMVGKDDRCITINGIDLEELGFTLFQGGLENGWHYGQDDDPKTIGQHLRDLGVTRYLFVLDEAGQFDLRFSAWVDESQLLALAATKVGLDPGTPADLVRDWYEECGLGLSPAELLGVYPQHLKGVK